MVTRTRRATRPASERVACGSTMRRLPSSPRFVSQVACPKLCKIVATWLIGGRGDKLKGLLCLCRNLGHLAVENCPDRHCPFCCSGGVSLVRHVLLAIRVACHVHPSIGLACPRLKFSYVTTLQVVRDLHLFPIIPQLSLGRRCRAILIPPRCVIPFSGKRRLRNDVVTAG